MVDPAGDKNGSTQASRSHPLRTSQRAWNRLGGNSGSGFTLVELLVVIAVIAILAAMIMPAIHAVRRAAKQATCASNLRQVGAGILAYAADQRQLPPAIPSSNWTFGNMSVNSNASGAPSAAAAVFMGGFVDSPLIYYCTESSEVTPGWWNLSFATPVWDVSVAHQASEYTGTLKAWLEPASWTNTYIGYCWWAGFTPGYPVPGWGLASNHFSDSTAMLCSDMVCSPGATVTGNHLAGNGASRGGNIVFKDGSVIWRPAHDMQSRYSYYGIEFNF